MRPEYWHECPSEVGDIHGWYQKESPRTDPSTLLAPLPRNIVCSVESSILARIGPKAPGPCRMGSAGSASTITSPCHVWFKHEQRHCLPSISSSHPKESMCVSLRLPLGPMKRLGQLRDVDEATTQQQHSKQTIAKQVGGPGCICRSISKTQQPPMSSASTTGDMILVCLIHCSREGEVANIRRRQMYNGSSVGVENLETVLEFEASTNQPLASRAGLYRTPLPPASHAARHKLSSVEKPTYPCTVNLVRPASAAYHPQRTWAPVTIVLLRRRRGEMQSRHDRTG